MKERKWQTNRFLIVGKPEQIPRANNDELTEKTLKNTFESVFRERVNQFDSFTATVKFRKGENEPNNNKNWKKKEEIYKKEPKAENHLQDLIEKWKKKENVLGNVQTKRKCRKEWLHLLSKSIFLWCVLFCFSAL